MATGPTRPIGALPGTSLIRGDGLYVYPFADGAPKAAGPQAPAKDRFVMGGDDNGARLKDLEQRAPVADNLPPSVSKLLRRV